MLSLEGAFDAQNGTKEANETNEAIGSKYISSISFKIKSEVHHFIT